MERALSTASASTRKRRGEGHTRRDEILLAAKELFLREGYQATTIRRIADVVGVSAPALYLYFRDKDAILIALSPSAPSGLATLALAGIEGLTGSAAVVCGPIGPLSRALAAAGLWPAGAVRSAVEGALG